MSTMRVPGAERKWTYADYARLPDDGNRYEVIDGEVYVTPAAGTRHQRISRKLFIALTTYIEEHALGELFYDLDLLFKSGQFFRPDMLFVPREAAARLKERGMYATPGLVVEVLSPSSQRLDREIKSRRYRDFGVPEYWVVDPDGRAIERYRPAGGGAPEICRDRLSWQPYADAPPFELDIQLLFG